MYIPLSLQRQISLCVLALAAFVVTGCTPVFSKKIIGTNPAPNLKSFEGTWEKDEGDAKESSADEKDSAALLKITDESAGLLTATETEKDQKPECMKLYVRALGEHVFISVALQDKDYPDLYSFVLVAAKGRNSLVLVEPKAETIVRLLEAKKLRGSPELDSDKKLKSVTLDDLSESECAELFTGPNMDSFDWEHPLLYVRKPLR